LRLLEKLFSLATNTPNDTPTLKLPIFHNQLSTTGPQSFRLLHRSVTLISPKELFSGMDQLLPALLIIVLTLKLRIGNSECLFIRLERTLVLGPPMCKLRHRNPQL